MGGKGVGPGWGYLRQLDGVRAVAVVLVLLYHARMGTVGGGFVGVDVFFVLSGFLVSSVVLAEIDRTGRLEVGAFYARRVRRLLPAAVLVVVVICLVWLVTFDVVSRIPLVGDARAALLYAANWHFLVQSNDYFAAEQDASPFLHFWSLAIEEQFYIVLPVVLVLVHRWARRPGRVFAVIVAVLLALSAAAQLYWWHADPSHAYYGTDARMYQLLAGVLLALALRRTSVERPRSAGLCAWAGMALLALLASGLLELSPTWRGLWATVAALLVIGGVARAADGVVGRVLSLPPITYLGRISYGVYLWHWPVLLVLRHQYRFVPHTMAAIGLVVSVALAAASYAVLERPIRRTRLLEGIQWRVVLSGLTVSAVVAAFLVPQVLDSERKPLVAAPGQLAERVDHSAAGEAAVPEHIDFASFSASESVHTCRRNQPQRCVLVRGKGPHVLLVGDSNAGMLLPSLTKLAREHDFTLSANVVSGCWWTDGPDNRKVSASLKRLCRESRGKWYDTVLPKLKPDVVLLVQRPREGDEWRTGAKLDPTARVYLDQSTDVARSTLRRISGGAWNVLVLRSVMGTGGFKAVRCLAVAKKVGQCAIPPQKGAPYSDGIYRDVAARDPHVWTTSINDIVCPHGPLCLPVRGGQVVWRDPHHLTLPFVDRYREQIWTRLRSSPAFD